jgi:hypothetical protein
MTSVKILNHCSSTNSQQAKEEKNGFSNWPISNFLKTINLIKVHQIRKAFDK